MAETAMSRLHPTRPGSNCTNTQRRHKARGFTFTELLVVVFVLAVLGVFLIPVIAITRSASQSAACLNNLRQIYGGFQEYAKQNGGVYPDPGQTHVSWEQSLRPYVGTQGKFACPADAELFKAVGSSYDWRDTGNAQTTLAGRDLRTVARPGASLAFDALPGWHAKRQLNVIRLDGSAVSVDQDQWFNELETPLDKP
jgi:prepilin-type N-terminal cleavage/methylation domain-containing protein